MNVNLNLIFILNIFLHLIQICCELILKKIKYFLY